MTAILQTETHTAFDRYPDLFQAAAALSLTELRSRPLKILSFGCSLGAELETLARYFPEARLYGCDINDEMVAAATARTAGHATVFRSSPAAMAEHGPFDLVFAMSVLCLYGRDERRIKKMLPFGSFELALAQLDAALADPGLLVLYNTSYKPRDAAVLAGYARILHPAVAENGFVHKHGRSAEVAARRVGDTDGFYDLVAPAEFRDEDFTDALFLKGAGRAGRLAFSQRTHPDEIERLRPSVSVDLGAPAATERELRLQRRRALFHDADGTLFRVTRARRRSVPAAGTYHHPPLLERWDGGRFVHLEGDLLPLPQAG